MPLIYKLGHVILTLTTPSSVVICIHWLILVVSNICIANVNWIFLTVPYLLDNLHCAFAVSRGTKQEVKSNPIFVFDSHISYLMGNFYGAMIMKYGRFLLTPVLNCYVNRPIRNVLVGSGKYLTPRHNPLPPPKKKSAPPKDVLGHLAKIHSFHVGLYAHSRNRKRKHARVQLHNLPPEMTCAETRPNLGSYWALSAIVDRKIRPRRSILSTFIPSISLPYVCSCFNDLLFQQNAI